MVFNKRLKKLDTQFQKGPKFTYWPGLSFTYAFAKAGFFDVGKMQQEATEPSKKALRIKKR